VSDARREFYCMVGSAAGALTLLFVGIRDAWDVALWISTHPDGKA
jgi:hypothetical protein